MNPIDLNDPPDEQQRDAVKRQGWESPLEALSQSLRALRIPFDDVALDSSRAYWDLAQAASQTGRALKQCDSERIALLPLKAQCAALEVELQERTRERDEAKAALVKSRRDAGTDTLVESYRNVLLDLVAAAHAQLVANLPKTPEGR